MSLHEGTIAALKQRTGRRGMSAFVEALIQRELERAMTQVGDTARSIRLLADFLDRHPEALVRGRSGVGR